MKKRIFTIALIMLITLSIFVPISASAEENYYQFFEDANLPTILVSDKLEMDIKEYHDMGGYIIVDNWNDTGVYILYACVDMTAVYNSQYDKYEYVSTYATSFLRDKQTDATVWQQSTIFEEGNTLQGVNLDWVSRDILDENGEVFVQGQWSTTDTPDYDTPDVTYTIPAGLYIFNPTPTMPTEDITQDFTTYFSVMINNGLENVVYNGLRMKFTPTTIEYNLDGTLTTVYKGPPLADVGWSHDGYRQVTFIEDVAVSEEFYNLFMANTTPPPEYKPPYVFSNDGITYDGSTYATYENDDTKRIEIDGMYCCMFQSNNYTFVATASEPLRLHTSTIKTKSGERLEYWTIKNGVITYSGNKLDFAIPHSWIAGNHSILNWDDDLQYHGFDVGMVFPMTPQTQLPTVVGAEMMTGVTREMIAILPCLIALLTGLLALRKALAILRQILQTA